MIDREYVEKKHIKARNWQGQISVSASALAELCRVYLALLDAPEVEDLSEGNLCDLGALSDEAYALIGKRVRLVEVKE